MAQGSGSGDRRPSWIILFTLLFLIWSSHLPKLLWEFSNEMNETTCFKFCHCQLFLIHWHSKRNLRWLTQFCVGFFLILYLIKCVFSFINLFFSKIQSGHLEYIRSWNILKTNPWRHVIDLGDITESHPHYPSLRSLCWEEHRSVLKGTQVSFNR